MAHERRRYRDASKEEGAGGEKGGRRDKTETLQELVDEALSRLRTQDSQYELLKQRIDAIAKQILIIKRAVLIEKRELLDLQKLEQQRRDALAQIEGGKETEADEEGV